MSISGSKRIRLHFKCKNLADLDTFSKSDPYVVLYEGVGPFQQHPTMGLVRQQRGRILGRTEMIRDNLNPVFAQPVEMEFLFETRQDLIAVVYDDDGKGPQAFNGDDVCGQAFFQLSHVICSREGRKEFMLASNVAVGQMARGSIEVSFTDVNAVSSRSTLRFGLSGKSLRQMSLVGGVNAFFTLSRLQPNGSKLVLHKSEVVASRADPKWAVSKAIPLSQLVGIDENDPVLEIEVRNQGVVGETGMGSVRVSVNDLRAANANKSGFSPRKAKDTSKYYGDIFVDTFQLTTFPTFTQSLASGWQINMALSIDFTGSNGDPRTPGTLHYMDPKVPNQYVSALMSVGDILMEYDTDKQIPVFGFGAHLNGVTSHFFNVNMQQDPYVQGIQGALNAYGKFLPTCTLSGPTNFAPTIYNVLRGAKESEENRVYTVLLIITDGTITDMMDTIDVLVEADDAPLSIVIVGVGNADFTAMTVLDGDGDCLRSRTGRVSRRDLVQFVPYRDFLPPKPREALAAEVLREIPSQFEDYLMLATARLGHQHRIVSALPTQPPLQEPMLRPPPLSSQQPPPFSSSSAAAAPLPSASGCEAAPLPPVVAASSIPTQQPRDDESQASHHCCEAAPLPP